MSSVRALIDETMANHAPYSLYADRQWMDWSAVARKERIRLTFDRILAVTKMPIHRGDLVRLLRAMPEFEIHAETYSVSLAS